MESPLILVLTNFYVKKIEEMALTSTPFKLKCWFWYVDDTFAIWSHREEERNHCLDHLNRVQQRIQFTMEKETDIKLTFLDVLVIRRADGGFEHKIYRKPTHMDCCLNRNSNYHPNQKRDLIKNVYL